MALIKLLVKHFQKTPFIYCLKLINNKQNNNTYMEKLNNFYLIEIYK